MIDSSVSPPELPPRLWRMLLGLLRRLPQGALSRALGRVADVPVPGPARGPILGAFARAVGIRLDEAELPLKSYRSVNELFVRRLRPDVRRWPGRPDRLASPVDGVLGQLGTTNGDRIVQAKGRWYSAAELLSDSREALRYHGGTFLTLYLSPRHYHRIHTPLPGRVVCAAYVPGALLPVNSPAVMHVQDLFARNERLICYVDGELGRVAVVAVGAYNVGRISAAFDRSWQAQPGRSGWVTNRTPAIPETRAYDPPLEVAEGQEIMAFHLGSTVILLCEPGSVRLQPDLRPGQEVKLGQILGSGSDPLRAVDAAG
jgi:phosphatidylserine decarboxylase